MIIDFVRNNALCSYHLLSVLADLVTMVFVVYDDGCCVFQASNRKLMGRGKYIILPG